MVDDRMLRLEVQPARGCPHTPDVSAWPTPARRSTRTPSSASSAALEVQRTLAAAPRRHAVPAEGPVARDHPVARDEEPDRVAPDRPADGPRRARDARSVARPRRSRPSSRGGSRAPPPAPAGPTPDDRRGPGGAAGPGAGVAVQQGEHRLQAPRGHRDGRVAGPARVVHQSAPRELRGERLGRRRRGPPPRPPARSPRRAPAPGRRRRGRPRRMHRTYSRCNPCMRSTPPAYCASHVAPQPRDLRRQEEALAAQPDGSGPGALTARERRRTEPPGPEAPKGPRSPRTVSRPL